MAQLRIYRIEIEGPLWVAAQVLSAPADPADPDGSRQPLTGQNLQLTFRDKDGANVPGVAWPIGMSGMPGHDGWYQAEVSENAEFAHMQSYTAEINHNGRTHVYPACVAYRNTLQVPSQATLLKQARADGVSL